MKTQKTRIYKSPLREAHTRDTSERIMQAVADALMETPDGNISIESVAKIAAIERRTVFRHFANKEAMLDAFWVWVNARVTERTLPESLAALIEAPKKTFARFDVEEGLIRASLHSQAGREMRLRTVPDRQAAFRTALGETTQHLDPAEAARIEAITHVLYSAAAWETLKDYCGLSGAEAGAAVSWALARLTGVDPAATLHSETISGGGSGPEQTTD